VIFVIFLVWACLREAEIAGWRPGFCFPGSSLFDRESRDNGMELPEEEEGMGEERGERREDLMFII
jgi:hypothetical protein